MSKEKKVCGEPCDIYTRVVGYFRPTKNFNIGKKQEFKERVSFKLPSEEANGDKSADEKG